MGQWSLSFCYAGAVIVLAMVIGGGTEQGLWTDHLLQIVMLPALYLGLGGIASSRFSSLAKILVVCILVVVLVQFAPIIRNAELPEILPSFRWTVIFVSSAAKKPRGPHSSFSPFWDLRSFFHAFQIRSWSNFCRFCSRACLSTCSPDCCSCPPLGCPTHSTSSHTYQAWV